MSQPASEDKPQEPQVETPEANEVIQKKEYETPTLEPLGSIQNLTKAFSI